jgi:hypothetical protein
MAATVQHTFSTLEEVKARASAALTQDSAAVFKWLNQYVNEPDSTYEAQINSVATNICLSIIGPIGSASGWFSLVRTHTCADLRERAIAQLHNVFQIADERINKLCPDLILPENFAPAVELATATVFNQTIPSQFQHTFAGQKTRAHIWNRIGHMYTTQGISSEDQLTKAMGSTKL